MHNNTRNDTNDSMNFDEFRKSYELPHHWQLRKEFLQLYADKFDIDRLICLSNVFVNVECMGLSYPEGVMKLVKELKTKVRGLEVYKYQYEKDEPEQPRKQVRRRY